MLIGVAVEKRVVPAEAIQEDGTLSDNGRVVTTGPELRARLRARAKVGVDQGSTGYCCSPVTTWPGRTTPAAAPAAAIPYRHQSRRVGPTQADPEPDRLGREPRGPLAVGVVVLVRRPAHAAASGALSPAPAVICAYATSCTCRRTSSPASTAGSGSAKLDLATATERLRDEIDRITREACVSDLAAAAICYAARGWYVFPLAPRGKRPLTRRGLHDATRDPGLIAAWWEAAPGANIGVDCGRSWLEVIDLDSEEAAQAWAELAGAHGGHARTLAAKTASGWHVYFAGQGRSTTGRLAPGIDTRGRGGYVVAPPSVHASGHVYRWLDADAPVALLPRWVEEALAPPPPAAIGELRDLPAGMPYTRYGLVALAGLVDAMEATREGQRNATLNAVAYRAGRLAAAGEIAEPVAFQALIDAALTTGLAPAEAGRTFESGFRAGLARPALVGQS